VGFYNYYFKMKFFGGGDAGRRGNKKGFLGGSLQCDILFLRKEKKYQKELPRGLSFGSANTSNVPYGYPFVYLAEIDFFLLLAAGGARCAPWREVRFGLL
jgi:hypothetical protein